MIPGVDNLGLFILAGLLLNLTPGPDVLFIVTQSVRSGARAGVVAALGITAGCFVHIAAAALGISALVATSATAFSVLKWIGAAYLLYVGISMLLRSGGSRLAAPDPSGAVPLRAVFLRAFWTNALNPKVALFFLAFLPQFIAPDNSSAAMAFIALGLVFNLNGLWVNVAFALAAAWIASRLGTLQSVFVWLDRVAGGLFLWFGVRLALSERP